MRAGRLPVATASPGNLSWSDQATDCRLLLLKIPEPLRIYHLVPIGYAKSQVAAPPRRRLDEMVHYESYDVTKYRDDDGAMEKFVRTLTLQGSYGKAR